MLRLGCSATRLVLAATLVALAADASAQERMMCGYHFDGDVAALKERIRQLPDARWSPVRNLRGLEGIYVRPPRFVGTDGAIGTVWDFTPNDHPAHPSVWCFRVVNMRGRGFEYHSQFHCRAAKEQCDKLGAE